ASGPRTRRPGRRARSCAPCAAFRGSPGRSTACLARRPRGDVTRARATAVSVRCDHPRPGVGSLPVAEILALVAAFFFALAATLQQKGALDLGSVSLGAPPSLVARAKQTWWLLGTVALLCGYAFQAVALANGRLAVIQPLLVTTIVFALPLGYFLTSQVIHRREVLGAAVVVLGLAIFT